MQCGCNPRLRWELTCQLIYSFTGALSKRRESMHFTGTRGPCRCRSGGPAKFSQTCLCVGRLSPESCAHRTPLLLRQTVPRGESHVESIGFICPAVYAYSWSCPSLNIPFLGWISVYEGQACPYPGVSLGQSLAPKQLNSRPLVGPVISPPRHYLRVRFTLESVVEKLGQHPFERFHQSIALQSFLPDAAIPSDSGDERCDRFEAQSIQVVSIQFNPEPKHHTHTVYYSFQRRNNGSRRKMHFTWLSSASYPLWQFVPDVRTHLRRRYGNALDGRITRF